ncbi:helix-turn-helix domain-containing protein [Kitasatospora sp. NPDC006697]|uniref:helix-turn-helix domain-containing protein n=1 Tax=Kitasatospora sp. NPDC006697 TaxID=3364020 RepID=UPI00368DEA39
MGAKSRPLTPDRSVRHLFGFEVRRYREAANMSLEGLARVVRYSKSHLSRIEAAEVMIPEELPPMLDAAFGTDGHFVNLYQHARNEIHPEPFRQRMEIEARSRLIQEYVCQVVPGLLQTEDYARAQFRAGNLKLSGDQLEGLVIARMSRQELLRADPPPEYSAILDEAVLRRPFGGPSVMRAQLERLANMTLTSHTVIQVMPFDRGPYYMVGGSLTLLTTADGGQVAWEESITTGTLLEDRSVVAARLRAYDLLRACALSPSESAAFIRSIMEALPE